MLLFMCVMVLHDIIGSGSQFRVWTEYTMAKTKCRVVVRSEFCKGCNLCIEYCKKGALKSSGELNTMGYHCATADAEKECIGCMVCTLVCPEVAIEVYSE